MASTRPAGERWPSNRIAARVQHDEQRLAQRCARLGRQVEDVEADPTRRVNVGMVDWRDEVNLGRLERVSWRYADAELESSVRVRRPVGALNHCARARDGSSQSVDSAASRIVSTPPASSSLVTSSFIHALIPGEGS
eukprot:2384439-Prymnesium_polylepis.1